jgi:prepilin-type processing-associated H-X9-DG protein
MRLSAIGSEHPGGASISLVDGSVRFLLDSTEQSLLLLYCTRADAQPVSTP